GHGGTKQGHSRTIPWRGLFSTSGSCHEEMSPSSHSRRKMVGIGCELRLATLSCERHWMSVARERPRNSSSPAAPNSAAATADDPVMNGLRDSAQRMISIALFSGVINLLMLSGSLYMLQVYDRVIPSRNIATLLGLWLMVLLAYLMQGYLDALRSRMLCRVATLFDAGLQDSIQTALATLPLRGVKPTQMQQPLRDLDQVRAFMA